MVIALLRLSQRPQVIRVLSAGALTIGIVSKFCIQDAMAFTEGYTKAFKNNPSFISLTLESSELISHDTKRLRFKLPERDAVSGLPLTCAIMTIPWSEDRWLPVFRPYSPVTPPGDRGFMDLIVKHHPTGRSSTYLHSMVPGQCLRFVAYMKGYRWKPNAFQQITAIAGGTGITPIYQLLQGIFHDQDDKTRVTVIFGVRSDKDIILKKEFEQMERGHPGRLKMVYLVSHPERGSPYRKGQVTKQLLQEVLEMPQHGDTKVFICGPPAMEAVLEGSQNEPGILAEVGFRRYQIHKF